MTNPFAPMSTDELRQRLHGGGLGILDARPVDAYNGWRLPGEQRGGHVPGARSLPAQWLGSPFWLDVVRKKELSTDAPVVVYGEDGTDAARVAAALSDAGFGDVRVYDQFAREWSADDRLPLERLPRFKQLVPPVWLKSVIEGERPEASGAGKLVICHAHYRNSKDYERGHVPGAIALSTLALEDERTWNRRTPDELRRALEQHGITHDSTVVVYGRFSSPDHRDPFPGANAGHLGAMRCAAILLYAGVEDVRVLNGGLMAWEAAGYETTTDPSSPVTVTDFGANIPGRPGVMMDMPEVKALLASERSVLVSVRSYREYIGEVSGYNYIDVKGRIPGAVFGDCGSDAYHMENYRNPDHTTREYGEIADRWRRAGITPDKRVAFYCGTGWRASEAFFNAYLMAWPEIAVYDGGFMEWSSDPRNPIATGIPA